MTIEEGEEILNKCIEIHTTAEKMKPEWMKICIHISVRKDAVQLVYNNSLKHFGEHRVFQSGEIIHYKGLRIELI